MYKILSSLSALAILITPAIALAHGEEEPGPHDDHSVERREGGVNPWVAGGFAVAVAGAVGFFVFTRMKNKGSPPPPATPSK